MVNKSSGELRVTEVLSRPDHFRFVELPYLLYRDDPNWVPPLRREETRRWDPACNATLASRPHWRFLAWRGDRVLGRISASLDHDFSERWRPRSGFFGFFECFDCPEAARLLFNAAERRLASQGAREIIGPVNLTTQDEVGLLTAGFGDRPWILSPYNPEWYPRMLEAAGFAPLRQYHAYAWSPQSRLEPAMESLCADRKRWAARIGVSFRKPEVRAWEVELRSIHAIYNQAFQHVWGYTAISWLEFLQRAERFKTFFSPDLVVLAEKKGEVVGFGLALPDINVLLQGLGGRLLPFGWIKLMAHSRNIRSARYILLGVRPELNGSGLGMLITAEMLARARKLGIRAAELSIVDECNAPVRRIIGANGAVPVKSYTLYAKRTDADHTLKDDSADGSAQGSCGQ
jgi:GNAT superfamily N-acetyltransferase